ncbi:MAG: hypothetical protein A3F72_06780 [Bacteroidetes bacterium RIFCSPLOWO2_12_FULL_35_15]|nr:MAG: hypothetical protein A3F72_06780 [Bacteroidetes bacterium RIFCSPLOWO2_12_FULL_35_15]
MVFSQTQKKIATKIVEDNFIENFLKQYPEKFNTILKYPDKYEVQIIYTQINRDEKNIPSFRQYTYRLDPENYFYAASLVKLPCSALALEKINNLNIPELNKNIRMQTDSAAVCQKKVIYDATAFKNDPTVAHYIKRMLLISDNDAYGRIYEFLGQQYMNEELWKKGYPDIRITHRFDAACNTAQNRSTNPVSFYNDQGKCVYSQTKQTNQTELSNPFGTVKKGIGYIDKKGKLQMQPKDYTYMNNMSLQDITEVLKSLMFPNSVEEKKRFNLTKEDYDFLYKYLSMYPRESDDPKYKMKDFEDSYKKYFIYGTHHKKIENDTIRIFNIVGQSYGYLSDCAYIVNTDRKIEFMLSAVIYVNEDGIINDGKYEYKTIGFPFLADLGNSFYIYELKRKKEHLPDLSNFKVR